MRLGLFSSCVYSELSEMLLTLCLLYLTGHVDFPSVFSVLHFCARDSVNHIILLKLFPVVINYKKFVNEEAFCS